MSARSLLLLTALLSSSAQETPSVDELRPKAHHAKSAAGIKAKHAGAKHTGGAEARLRQAEMRLYGGDVSGVGASGGVGGGEARTAAKIAALLRLSRRVPVIRTMADLELVAAAVATADRELMFTTVTMDRSLFQLVFLRQWQGNLRSAAPHALLIGNDNRTCMIARNATVPCFVDGLAPSLSGRQNNFGSQVLLKWWYARALLGLDYHIVFSDPDITWLSDPFARWVRAFDLQGLSDIRSTNLTVQKHHEITCIRPWMETMYEHSRRSIYPCQSTGLWYMRNRPQSRALLDGLYSYLGAKPNEWEQKAFQLIVMRYLIGLGDDLPPLHYRLLPTAQFINIEYYGARQRLGLEVSGMIAVHCGYLKNIADKLEHLEMHGFLRRGLAHHRKVYSAVVALGEVDHGRTLGDPRM